MTEQNKQPTIDDIIANKDRIIGQLYQRCVMLEEAFARLQKSTEESKAKDA